MRHALLVALALALAPVAADAFRPWPVSAPAVPAEPAGLVLGTEARPPYHLEPYGSGYVILPGGIVSVGSASWGNALGYQPCPGDVVMVGSGSALGTAFGTGK